MQLLSIQVGQPQTHYTPDPAAVAKDTVTDDSLNGDNSNANNVWESGIFKQRVDGPRFVGRTNLDGDAQADRKGHGGPDKAICVYPHEHYPALQTQHGANTVPTGAFGENFTTAGLLEGEVCIGDTFAMGAAQAVIVQVSQPRQPCWKLARRWQIADLVEQLQRTGSTGWYFRVLQEGVAEAGNTFTLLDRPFPHLTIAEANRIMHHDKEDWEAIGALLACPLLSASWQSSLRRRINLHAPAEVADRIYGRT